MSDDHVDDPEHAVAANRAARPTSAERTASDERTATIERLERAVAEEQEKSAALQSTVDQLRFKLEILEKSYAKQLADARQKSDAAEGRLVALASGHADTIAQLAETRGELDRVTAEREALRKQLTRKGRSPGLAQDDESEASEGTINRLMESSGWLHERQARGESHPDLQVPSDVDTPSEEMLPGDLVFPKKGDDE